MSAAAAATAALTPSLSASTISDDSNRMYDLVEAKYVLTCIEASFTRFLWQRKHIPHKRVFSLLEPHASLRIFGQIGVDISSKYLYSERQRAWDQLDAIFLRDHRQFGADSIVGFFVSVNEVAATMREQAIQSWGSSSSNDDITSTSAPREEGEIGNPDQPYLSLYLAIYFKDQATANRAQKAMIESQGLTRVTPPPLVACSSSSSSSSSSCSVSTFISSQ